GFETGARARARPVRSGSRLTECSCAAPAQYFKLSLRPWRGGSRARRACERTGHPLARHRPQSPEASAADRAAGLPVQEFVEDRLAALRPRGCRGAARGALVEELVEPRPALLHGRASGRLDGGRWRRRRVLVEPFLRRPGAG